MPEDHNDAGLLSNMVKLLPLYAVYLFIPGWTFYDYYFRYFGVNPRWLDIAFNDTLTRGFAILFAGGKELWWVYVPMVIAPIVSEGLRGLQNRPILKRVLEYALVILLVCIPVVTYIISRDVGIRQAKLDKSDQSTLPTVSFTANKHFYRGNLLFIRNGMYFIHNLKEKDESRKVQEVSIFRAEEVSDMKIVEFE